VVVVVVVVVMVVVAAASIVHAMYAGSNLFVTKKNIMQHKENKANMSTGHKGSMKLH